MRRLIASINVTPDGFCDHTKVVADEELHDYTTELVRNISAALFGRVTYQLFEQYWPGISQHKTGKPAVDEFALLIDNIPKIVFSKTLAAASWKNSTLIKDNAIEEIKKLKQQAGKDLLIFGSPGLLSSLARENLVDEYQFVIQPILAASGKRLFENDQALNSLNLELVNTRLFKSGALLLHYTVK